MALNLRDFLTALGKDLIRIDDEVDPITQAGALCSAAPRPILLERLRGFPGWKLCDILVKDRARQALALGTSPGSVVRELSDRMFTRVPGQSKVVPDGPCKEVKLLGNDADITKLPIPIHSEGDAGRYLGSGITITRDPDTGVRNEAIIRAMVKGPRRMGFWMAARHNWAHLMKYQERGLPAPMAFAIGLHPGYEILANYSGRHEGYDELEMGAGVLGETLELVKCETIDLEVPAQAEVVIEGVVPPGVGDDVHRLRPDDAALGRPGPRRAAGRALEPLPPPEDRDRGGRRRRHLRSARGVLGDVDAGESREGRHRAAPRAHPSARRLGAQRGSLGSDRDARRGEDRHRRDEAAALAQEGARRVRSLETEGRRRSGAGGVASAPGVHGVGV